MELRQAAKTDQKFIVFVIGMRSNHWWKIWKTIKIAIQMAGMQKELAQTDLGCLSMENWFGRTTISLQYWKSFEELEAYSQANRHMKAWREYASNKSVGVWHETYEIKSHEAVYVAMPSFGLGKAIGTVCAKGAMKTARKRLETSLK